MVVYAFTDTEITIFRGIGWLFLLLNVILLTVAMHNTIRYLCGLKIKKPLIIWYYVLALLAIIYKCGCFVALIFHTPKDYDTEFLFDL